VWVDLGWYSFEIGIKAVVTVDAPAGKETGGGGVVHSLNVVVGGAGALLAGAWLKSGFRS